MSSDSAPAMRAVGINRTYGKGESAVHACQDASLSVQPGELLVVKGPSGSGKTTLLNCIGGLDEPDSGTVFIGDRELTAMRESDRVELRQTQLGFVFQSFGLIPILSAAENVEVPMRLVGMPPAERQARVDELLELVGLADHHHQRPAELSGGQQQRVGLARSLANRPKLLIADEPTGQLDSVTAGTMMDLISDLVHSHGVAAIVSTHDPLLMQRADRVLELHDGRILGGQATASAGASSVEPSDEASPEMIEVPRSYSGRHRRNP
ncbi:putative ABC transport system ATP-binding protein [Arthrobacter pigmenti]|uniref:Putative ABC transport system ATP-binding protein n=1 Tax=Arthrobacter pigmenti TaxID=271432 RepID=A0A846RVR9_9MICC|nr:ABC transporter ATP-binding protein [Arthrobacter pigmenti]NJC23126.1 putative ABC transport system ATP-binding protein [Arthrobacter pigmenti]